jgi:hypothetical protein
LLSNCFTGWGGRTLITSQANLAVDNALSRLVHNPVIRAVRKGKAEKIGEEGQAFLQDKVIDRWLENPATNCENNLAKRQENIKILRKLLVLEKEFAEYFQAEPEFNQQEDEFKEEKENIDIICKNQELVYNEALTQKAAIESLTRNFDKLLKSRENINWDSSEVKEFLPLLQPCQEGKHQVENLRANVRQAIKYTDVLGFVSPVSGAFGLAVWLRETIATEISEFKPALIYANDGTIPMSELAIIVY